MTLVEYKLKMEKGPIYIYYASHSGTAAGFAKSLAHEAADIGIKAEVSNILDFTPEKLKSQDYFIFVVATHYDGNCPDDADKFWEWIQKPEDKAFLKGKHVTLFGLGDTTYETFNQFSKDLDHFFKAYGMK